MSTILLWAWTPTELLSRSYNSHHHLFSFFFVGGGAEKQTSPQTTTTIGPGGCPPRPHGDASSPTRPPSHRRRNAKKAPAPQVSLFANFLMCPPNILRGIPHLPLTPSRTTFSPPGVCAAKPRSGRGTRGGWGCTGSPGPRSWPQRGRGCLRGSQVLLGRPHAPRPARPGPHLGSPV